MSRSEFRPPPMVQEAEQTQKSAPEWALPIDQSDFVTIHVPRSFLRRIGFVLRALPGLIRDAWRDSRFV